MQAITASDVSRNFRIVALSIHPDRCSLPGARQAFDALNKAHIQLRDDVTRAAAVREHAVRPGDADISASGSMVSGSAAINAYAQLARRRVGTSKRPPCFVVFSRLSRFGTVLSERGTPR